MGLSGGGEVEGGADCSGAGVFGVGGAAGAGPAHFGFAVAAAAVVVEVVAVVAGQREPAGVAADLEAEGGGEVEVEAGLAGGAGVAGGAAEAAAGAGQAAELLGVEVSGYVAGGSFVGRGRHHALAVDVSEPGVALADAVDPGGAGFGVASFAV